MRKLSSIKRIFFSSFFFYLILQIENIVKFYWAKESTVWEEFCYLIISQGENLLFASVACSVYFLIKNIKWLRIAFYILLSLTFIYWCIDQAFYGLYFDHINLTVEQEGKQSSFALLTDSVVYELNKTLFYFNLVLAILFSLFNRKITRLSACKLNLKAFIPIIILGVTLIYTDRPGRNIEHHPTFSFIYSIFQVTDTEEGEKYDTNLDLFTLRYGTQSHSINSENGVEEFLTDYKQHSDSSKKNLIYIIIESVGAELILKQQKLDPKLTPNLYKLMPNMAIFPKLYNFFPGSVRSHMAIHHGGRILTWGNLFKEFNFEYEGATWTKELKKKNYNTGFFAATQMGSENCEVLYENQKFDTLYIPGQRDLGKDYLKKHSISSWGVDESIPLQAAFKWIDNVKDNSSPFFFEWMNSNTHHPYSTTKNYIGPYNNSRRDGKAKNAIHYFDNEIGKLLAYLKKNDLEKNTIIAISGDHGEAFGIRHKTNFLHRSYLYEENIRNFLLLIDFNQNNGPFISQKQGSIGDIMPTTLDLINNSDNLNIPGQSLFNPKYHQKIKYFHKISAPKKWGLIDGNWKYIVEQHNSQKNELYNLKSDSTEQSNLASKFPEKIKIYNQLIKNWYIYANIDYSKLLKGFKYDKGTELSTTAITDTGLVYLKTGWVNEKSEFNELQKVNPNQNLALFCRKVLGHDSLNLEILWRNPKGVIKSDFIKVNQLLIAFRRDNPFKNPLQIGKWTVTILNKETKKELIKTEFSVFPKAKLMLPKYGHTEILIGTKTNENFVKLDSVNPNENIVIQTKGLPFYKENKVKINFISPSNQKNTKEFTYNANWEKAWIPTNQTQPWRIGEWTIEILDKETNQILMKTNFISSPSQKCYDPIKIDFIGF